MTKPKKAVVEKEKAPGSPPGAFLCSLRWDRYLARLRPAADILAILWAPYFLRAM